MIQIDKLIHSHRAVYLYLAVAGLYIFALGTYLINHFVGNGSVIYGVWNYYKSRCVVFTPSILSTQEIGSILVEISALLLLVLLLIGLLKVLIISLNTHRFESKLEYRAKNGIRWIDTDKPEAFVIGVINSRVYISNWYKENLSGEELQSVIYHEQFHQKNHHPLLLLLFTLVSCAVPFIGSKENFIARLDIAADGYVKERVGGVLPLIRSLKKVLMVQGGLSYNNLFLSANFSTTERIRVLTGKKPNASIPLYTISPLMMGIIALFFLSLEVAAPHTVEAYDSSDGVEIGSEMYCKTLQNANMSRLIYFSPIR